MDIEQATTAYNAQRKSLAATRSKANRTLWYIFAALAVVLIAVSLWIYFSGSEPILYVVPFVGTASLLLGFDKLLRSADQPGKELQKTMRESIFPTLFSNIQDLRFETNTNGFLDEIPDGIKPDATEYFEGGDLIEGIYQGQKFATNEVTVFGRSGSGEERQTTTIFKGLAVRISLDHSVPNLSVRSDSRAVQRLAMEQYRAVGNKAQIPFDDEYFETIYNVHCENERFASSVFSEAGRSTFMGLQGSLSKSPIQLAATESTAYLLLSQQEDFFELPPLDRSFNMATDGRRLQDEMQRILDLSQGIRDLLKTGSTT